MVRPLSAACSCCWRPWRRAPLGPTRIPRAQAGADYARGIELAEQGLFAAALEQFKSAYEKSPHFAVLYNIGQAQMALGRPIEAIEALTRYLRDGADQVPLSRREQVQAQVALLESRLAELSVTTDRPGALVTVDGREVGKTPLYQPIRLAAGTHTVSIMMDGITPIIKAIDLREGERRALAFVVPPGIAPKPVATELPAATMVAPPPPPPPPRDLRKWSYVAGGGRAAAGAAARPRLTSGTRGATTSGRRRTRRSDARARSAAYHDAVAAEQHAAPIARRREPRPSSASSFASGVLIAGGVALYLVDGRASVASGSPPRASGGVGGSLASGLAVDWFRRIGWSATW